MSGLKELVTQYLGVVTSLEDINKRTKELTQTKKKLSENILEKMTEENVDACKLPDGGALVIKKTVRCEAIKPELIKSGLEAFFEKNGVQTVNPIETATSEILNLREESSSQSLRIIKGK